MIPEGSRSNLAQGSAIETHPGAPASERFAAPAPHTADVWVIELDRTASRPEVLAEDELGRANRFHFPADRERFIAGRTALRSILGGYLGIAPEKVAFAAAVNGKPRVCGGTMPLEFNLSHSGDMMLVAVTSDCPVGVDVEFMREDLPFEALAEQYFPGAEAGQMRVLHGSARKVYFYHTWTRCEAKLKATGAGLRYGIRGVDLSGWRAMNMKIDISYAAALAFPEGDRQIACRRWAQ